MWPINIDNDNNLINSNDRKYTKQEIFSSFIEIIVKAGFKVLDIKTGNPNHIKLSDGDYEYNLVYILKNISNAGWKNKPNYKRIQVYNLKNETKDINFNKVDDKFFVIYIGYYNFDNNPLLVVWDALRYLNHNTQRSCYVTTDMMQLAYDAGFIETIVSGQKVWISKPTKFRDMLYSISKYYEVNKNE